MKKNSSLKIVIGLVLLVIVLAGIHFAVRQPEEAGAIQVIVDGKTVSVPLSKLPLQDVSGRAVNGKGEEKTIEGKGTPLSEVLAQAGVDLPAIQQVRVVAADEFSAILTVREATEEGRAYLLQEEGEERPRLVVFGDPDSRRRVKDVARIEAE